MQFMLSACAFLLASCSSDSKDAGGANQVSTGSTFASSGGVAATTLGGANSTADPKQSRRKRALRVFHRLCSPYRLHHRGNVRLIAAFCRIWSGALAVVLAHRQLDRIYVIQTARVDRHRRPALALTARERFDAAGLAKKMVDVLRPELIVRQVVFTRQQFELVARHERKERARATAHRAVASNDRILEIDRNLVPDLATLTSALVMLG